MNELRQAFIDSLYETDFKYSLIGNDQLSITWSEKNIPPITTTFTFDDTDESVAIKSPLPIPLDFPGITPSASYTICSALNLQVRWLKFYITTENKMYVSSDAIIDIKTAGLICSRLFHLTRLLIGVLYWSIMKTLLRDQ